MQETTPIISIGFNSRLRNLRLVSSLLRHAGNLVGLPASAGRDLERAVAEAVRSCIRHPDRRRADRSIQLEITLEDQARLVVTVSDFGPPGAVDLDGLGRRRETGEVGGENRGFYQICSLMDEVEHDSSASGSRVRMVKLLDHGPSAYAPPVLERFRAAS